jgi:flagellar biogenesis protein FliO
LIRVGDAQVLVGISAAGIVALSPLSTPIAITPAARPATFADRLRELMKRPGASS